MVELLPVINSTEYEVSDTMWQQLQSEITRLTALIDAGTDLTPEDVKNVQTLARQVREYAGKYRKDITTQANTYKELLDQELNRLGYSTIETYVGNKRTQQQTEINNRLNQKLSRFQSLVREALDASTHVKHSAIAGFVSNSLATRFPKLNSGAANKEITNWEPVKSVITMSIKAVDNVFTQYPVLLSLPASAQSLRTITSYLESGDVHTLENIQIKIMEDQPILQRMVLTERVKTDAQTVGELFGILADNSINDNVKLQRVKLIMDVYQSR